MPAGRVGVYGLASIHRLGSASAVAEGSAPAQGTGVKAVAAHHQLATCWTHTGPGWPDSSKGPLMPSKAANRSVVVFESLGGRGGLLVAGGVGGGDSVGSGHD